MFYLAADKFSLGKSRTKPGRWSDAIWRFQIALRMLEYCHNASPTRMGRLLLKYYTLQKERLGFKLGFDIPPNVFGPGLRINHFGNIVINGCAKVGMWCDIHQGVNIGNNPGPGGGVPVIGDNVWLGPGAKLFGAITLGSGVAVGANAVVNKDFGDNITIAGIPAKQINDHGTGSMDVSASISRTKAFVEKNRQYADYFPDLTLPS